ncbi:recombinase family protein [Homoserinibacter gongjuensis]|uniref:Recombinase family protein n=1 Tax=Homoserinibacter gongjuensis TaxID=1162968 RepID=A0ABQ6JUS3_9MICO|nr:recombinase family protein [Homoserinibacter gongjuensis]GMA91928.1 hypothetical protein GCM10025869_24570 [Homoserinibacter gongjuensis]
MSKVVAAAIYARISRDVTGEGLGVERQLAECRKLAEQRGWTVAEEYVDNDISAYSGKTRPQYERMLQDVAEGRRDAVIAYHTDRLTRRPVELEHFMQVCDTAGMTHFATVTADIDLGNDDGLFMARILGAVAAKESARKSARLRSKARQNAEQGRVSGGGIRPFAYAADRVTVIESEAEVFRDLATRYLAGESLMSLTNWMQEQGIMSVAGKPWHTSVLRATLINPVTPASAPTMERSSPRRCGRRSSRPPSITSWSRLSPARRSPGAAPRAGICCRVCCGAGSAATSCSPQSATTGRSRPAATSACLVPTMVGAGSSP